MHKHHILNTLTKLAALGAALLPGLARAEIGVQAAAEIALMRVPGVVHEIEREQQRGRTLFEVEIRSDAGPTYEVLVDAADGAILEVKVDR